MGQIWRMGRMPVNEDEVEGGPQERISLIQSHSL